MIYETSPETNLQNNLSSNWLLQPTTGHFNLTQKKLWCQQEQQGAIHKNRGQFGGWKAQISLKFAWNLPTNRCKKWPTWGRGRQKSEKRADVFYEWSPSAQTHSPKPLLGSTWQKNEIFSLMLSSMGYFKPIFHLKSRNNLWSNWLFNKLVIAIWQEKKFWRQK